MRSRVLTVYEHQLIAVGSDEAMGISMAEAEKLVQLGQQRPGFCTLEHRSVRLAQYAGLVNLDGRILEILPKIGDDEPTEKSRGTFLRLLRHALDVSLFAQGAVGHDLRQQSLLEVFIAAYLQAVSGLVRMGLLRRYRTEEDDIRVIRGRLVIGRQATVHVMRIDRLACRFDELTADNPWNQVLKAALHAVRPWIAGIDTGRRWLELTAAFDEVELRRDAAALLDSLPLDRQVQHYQPALRWADWILRLLSPNLRAGRNQAPELLFDMNRLFESAIASVLSQRSRGSETRVTTQEADRHLAVLNHPTELLFFGLRPDLVIRDGGAVTAVGDTKWTRVEAGAEGWLMPSEAHAYQMNAYASVYPCEDFALLYPWHNGLSQAQATAFHLPVHGERKAKLHVVCIDVGNDLFPVRIGGNGSRFVDLLGKTRNAKKGSGSFR